MAGPAFKKRSRGDASKSRPARPAKKQKRQKEYHSSSEEESDDEGSFKPVNLLDSDDEDLENAVVDDGAASGLDSDSDSGSEANEPASRKPLTKGKPKEVVRDAPDSDTDGSEVDDEESDGSDGGDGDGKRGNQNTRSKRGDESAFATSISKILSSKLSTARRADPIVARSAEAHEASRQAVDAALDSKARKRLRDAKRLAMEKGRVRDVLIASTTRTLNIQTGEIEEVVDKGETTTEILETERRLRKVAQRGVVKLFNAVRAAQVKANEAERTVRKEGVVGMGRKGEKITEMSRKGFLDLIASGGGGLNKKPLEEG
ncbi:Rrp15p-domain-containing protein [Thozetella sp. PMI_491]|nr:Rrp15p-domain-containing protein [Thozetella sp. PMI_491]